MHTHIYPISKLLIVFKIYKIARLVKIVINYDVLCFWWLISVVQPWQEVNSFEKPSSESVLIASYALLTQLQYDNITTAFQIFNWLIQQKDKNGMFSSTQVSRKQMSPFTIHTIQYNLS